MYVVYKWERVADIVLVIIVVVVCRWKVGRLSFSRSLAAISFGVPIHMHWNAVHRHNPIRNFVWLTFPLTCVRTFDGVRCVSFGVLQMNGNKSAEAYFNTCNRDISSNGCACGDGMWHAINAFVQRAQKAHKRHTHKKKQQRTPLHPFALMNIFVLSFRIRFVSNGSGAPFAIFATTFFFSFFRSFVSFRIHLSHSQNTPIHTVAPFYSWQVFWSLTHTQRMPMCMLQMRYFQRWPLDSLQLNAQSHTHWHSDLVQIHRKYVVTKNRSIYFYICAGCVLHYESHVFLNRRYFFPLSVSLVIIILVVVVVFLLERFNRNVMSLFLSLCQKCSLVFFSSFSVWTLN